MVLESKTVRNQEFSWLASSDDEWIIRVATTFQEYRKLLERGFTYVSDYGDTAVKVLGKRERIEQESSSEVVSAHNLLITPDSNSKAHKLPSFFALFYNPRGGS